MLVVSKYEEDWPHIAQILNKTITCICDWERGRTEPSLQDLTQIADYFQVSTDYLLGRTNDIGLVEVQNELTHDQQELLSLYNKMSFQDKNQLLGFAKALVIANFFYYRIYCSIVFIF